MSNGRIACLGECMIELRQRPDGLLSRGFGGDTLNTAVYLARLGVPVDYVTALGDDSHSEAMLRAWAAEGVGTQHVLRLPGRVPGLYLIETDDVGERHFSYWRDSAPVRQLFDVPETSRIEAALADAAYIYLSGITLSLFPGAPRERLFAALEAARANGGKVVFDSNFRPRGWPDRAAARAVYDRMLRMTDIALAGVEDFALLNGTATAESVLETIRQAGVPEAVVKLIEPGCIVVADGRVTSVPVPEVLRPIDTTAAGDSFAAGYLAARLNGALPATAAAAAHRLAGVVIEYPGAIIPREAMPSPLPKTETA